MTTDKIKNKIESFVKQYQANSGTFEGFVIIYNYIDFLKNEPYTYKMLEDIFEYVESQKKILKELHKKKELDQFNPNEFVFDTKNPSAWPTNLVFKKMQESYLDKPEEFNIMEALPLDLLNLIMIYDTLAKTKNCVKTNDLKEAERITEEAKKLSTTFVPVKARDEKGNIMATSYSISAYFLKCMAIVGKYILDNIDSKAWLDNSKPKSPISFDKDNSLLNIRGAEIKIARQKGKPIDHYILECIFSKDDISDPADFSEISREYLKEEYDKAKDWNKFRHACDNLNKKIEKDTKDKINDFLTYSTEKLGWCKINQKHL